MCALFVVFNLPSIGMMLNFVIGFLNPSAGSKAACLY